MQNSSLSPFKLHNRALQQTQVRQGGRDLGVDEDHMAPKSFLTVVSPQHAFALFASQVVGPEPLCAGSGRLSFTLSCLNDPACCVSLYV